MDNSHYFAENDSLVFEEFLFRAVLNQKEYDFIGAKGVFSSSGLDKGTKILLDYNYDLPEVGNFLDIGCGWGSIALSMALKRPDAQVWAIDVNSVARQMCSINAKRLGLNNVVVAHPNDVPASILFDAILSNPPIRIGKTKLHELLLMWLPRLTVGCTANLVVQKNLGADSLQAWLVDALGENFIVQRAFRKKEFRIIEVKKF